MKGNYSTRVGAGPRASIPQALLLSIGVNKGDYIDFDFVNGAWQVSGRHQVSTDYFASPSEKTLSERLRRSIKEHVEFSDASEITADSSDITAGRRSARAKAAHE